MDYDYITDQAVKLQQFQDGESVKKDETPAQKLRTAAWGLNTKCSKPNCVLSEKDKKKAHQISSVVISFCEDSKYRDAEDWEARAQKFRVMIQDKSEELDRIEKEILDERKANPKVLAWDDTEGKYVKEAPRGKPWGQDKAGEARELEFSGKASESAARLEEARARIGRSTDMAALDDSAVDDSYVNWAGLGLTDADVTKLLEELGAVAVLDLSDNAIHDGGLQALIAASVSRPELKELRLAGNPFGQLGRTMLQGLASLRPDLRVVLPAGPLPAA
jgi:hypothetical protein